MASVSGCAIVPGHRRPRPAICVPPSQGAVHGRPTPAVRRRDRRRDPGAGLCHHRVVPTGPGIRPGPSPSRRLHRQRGRPGALHPPHRHARLGLHRQGRHLPLPAVGRPLRRRRPPQLGLLHRHRLRQRLLRPPAEHGGEPGQPRGQQRRHDLALQQRPDRPGRDERTRGVRLRAARLLRPVRGVGGPRHRRLVRPGAQRVHPAALRRRHPLRRHRLRRLPRPGQDLDHPRPRADLPVQHEAQRHRGLPQPDVLLRRRGPAAVHRHRVRLLLRLLRLAGGGEGRQLVGLPGACGTRADLGQDGARLVAEVVRRRMVAAGHGRPGEQHGAGRRIRRRHRLHPGHRGLRPGEHRHRRPADRGGEDAADLAAVRHEHRLRRPPAAVRRRAAGGEPGRHRAPAPLRHRRPEHPEVAPDRRHRQLHHRLLVPLVPRRRQPHQLHDRRQDLPLLLLLRLLGRLVRRVRERHRRPRHPRRAAGRHLQGLPDHRRGRPGPRPGLRRFRRHLGCRAHGFRPGVVDLHPGRRRLVPHRQHRHRRPARRRLGRHGRPRLGRPAHRRRGSRGRPRRRAAVVRRRRHLGGRRTHRHLPARQPLQRPGPRPVRGLRAARRDHPGPQLDRHHRQRRRRLPHRRAADPLAGGDRLRAGGLRYAHRRRLGQGAGRPRPLHRPRHPADHLVAERGEEPELGLRPPA
ncbi:hypothetical protein SBRY_160043 [Actinacidiphila bryophytorum]|uniref:Uncharacterized protein n=1 Tax=Actinacidiphila bryophytorum TaxID=1436133 RepID=A0A9W4E8W9_9ACTN|nr:hypothetical protein SBRY_160043 [Actinacidiphila bryophytorum]